MQGVLQVTPFTILKDADPVVQSVVALLLLSSILSWAVIVSRSWRIWVEGRSVRAIDAELDVLANPQDLANLGRFSASCASRILVAVGQEWQWSTQNGVRAYDQLRSRVLSTIDLSVAQESVTVAGKTSLLATVGSVAPFVGLFGTVWGIMRSFIAIGQAQDTSLAVVAPGIAEALMATAVGLFCAIPAVVGYNRLIGGINRLEGDWRTLAGQVELAISRQFEIGKP